MDVADDDARKSPLLPIVLLLLLAGGWFGGYYWWTHRSSTWTSPDGFSVDLPEGWIVATEKEGVMTAHGTLPGGGTGTAEARLLSLEGTTPHKALSVRGPDEYQETEIGGNIAGIAVYDSDGLRCLEAVVSGRSYIRLVMRCDKEKFEEHRSRFESCARSIRWSD